MFKPDSGGFAASKVAYLFPGQGSQYVGMGKELYENSAAARAVFCQVEEVVGFSLTEIMFQGPEEELNKTINAQPAILAVSLAFLKAMEETLGPTEMPRANFVAGHSLGEYTSLVATGVLSLTDATLVVQERGRLMQEASERVPGGLAAILGMEKRAVEEICQESGTRISNINSDDQMVIGGDQAGLARAKELADLRGAKRFILLPVSGAFHTDLMESAVPGMAAAFHGISFNDPVVPIIANCSGRPLTTGRGVKRELLRQICGCVQWKRSMTYMRNAGVTAYYEIGPGRVLAQLLRRIVETAQVMSVNNLAAVQKIAA